MSWLVNLIECVLFSITMLSLAIGDRQSYIVGTGKERGRERGLGTLKQRSNYYIVFAFRRSSAFTIRSPGTG